MSQPRHLPWTKITKKNSEYDVVISGGGPSAFLDAWEALKSGKKVLIVSDREFEPKNRKIDPKRVQRVSLYPENKEYLLNMLKNASGELRRFTSEDKQDIKCVVELMNSVSIAVKDVEDFLKRRLDELNIDKQLTYVSKSQFKNINMEDGVVTIEPTKDSEKKSEEQQVKFDFVVCADGNGHHAVNVLNENFADQPHITYKAMSKPKHLYHANTYITVERKDGAKLELPARQVVANSIGLTWILTFHPVAKSYAEGKRIKCFFNGEVPKDIHDAIKIRNKNLENEDTRQEQEQKVITHIQDIIQNYFQQANLNNGAELVVKLKNTGNDKDKLKLQAFEVNPFLANRVGSKMNEKEVGVTGDSARGANYQLGFGLNNAFDHARRLGEVFRRKKTIAQYNSESECNSTFLPSFEFTTMLTNIGCFRRFLGPGIESAIENKHNEFLRRCAGLMTQLRQQNVVREEEEKLNLPGTNARRDLVGPHDEKNSFDEYQRLLLMS